MLASAGRSLRSFRFSVSTSPAATRLINATDQRKASPTPPVPAPDALATWHHSLLATCKPNSPYEFPIGQPGAFSGKIGAVLAIQRAFSHMGTGGRGEFKVLFCGIQFPTAYEFTAQLLKPHPNIIVESCPTEQLSKRIGEFDVIIPRMCRLDAGLVGRATKAKLIVQFGVGLEGVDFAAAEAARVPVARINGASNNFNAISCAEMCIYLILALLRQQAKMRHSFQNMILGEPTGETILGKTVLIVGFGAIGRELAPRLKPFGCTVLATRRRWSNVKKQTTSDENDESRELEGDGDNNSAVDERGGPEDLLPFAAKADIIVMCCMLNEETAGMVDAKFYDTMKQGAMLVNIARGGLLDYDATLAALEGGKLGGLGIDVAWREPFDPEDPIAKHPNTIITPHVGGVTTKSYNRMAQIMSDTILEVYRGQPLTLVEVANK